MKDMKFKIKDADQYDRLNTVLQNLGYRTNYTPIIYNSKVYGLFTYYLPKNTSYCSTKEYFDNHATLEMDTEKFIDDNTPKKETTMTTKTPHKHADVIRAFADGYSIQFWDTHRDKWRATKR